MKKHTLFVTGIGTEVGKTIISSVLVQALNADYWKPVQAGDLDDTDSHKIERYSDAAKIHPEGFRLNTPMSPHAAAAIDGIEISLDDFHIPETDNHLIIEGAGGLYVPLNDKDCVIDLLAKMQIPVVLVSRNYLGSINHTLLSINALKERNVPIFGVIFNGKSTPTTEEIIERMTGVKVLGRVEEMNEINRVEIAKSAEKFRFLQK
jgi:dethiobiotin synthetase